MTEIPGNGVKSFGKVRTKHLFRVDDTDDVFEAVSAIPAETLADFAGRFANMEDLDVSKRFGVIIDVLEMVLLPTSFAILRKRMSDKENPIELNQLNDILVWLLEQYGLRPTQPSSDLSGGQSSPEPGTNLTADV
jgi:hypothetical protein